METGLAGVSGVEGEDFVEAGGEFGHAGENDVGAGLAENLGVEGAGVDGNSEDAGGMTSLDTERSILDNDGFGGIEVACLTQAHEIGIGHGFAMTNGTILRGDHSSGIEDVRINKIQFAEERGLAAA